MTIRLPIPMLYSLYSVWEIILLVSLLFIFIIISVLFVVTVVALNRPKGCRQICLFKFLVLRPAFKSIRLLIFLFSNYLLLFFSVVGCIWAVFFLNTNQLVNVWNWNIDQITCSYYLLIYMFLFNSLEISKQ